MSFTFYPPWSYNPKVNGNNGDRQLYFPEFFNNQIGLKPAVLQQRHMFFRLQD